jgi:pilus assembly protein CpaC
VRLEVRPRVSEIDPTLSITINGTSVPGFRMREVDTGVEMKFGQTLAIAGLLQKRETMVKRGIPYLMDMPFVGAAFSRKSSKITEVELLILVRPELVEALDPEQVPPCGPGTTSMAPDDCGLFWKGYMEVPVQLPTAGPAAPGPHGPMMAPENGQPTPGEYILPGEPVNTDDPQPVDGAQTSARRQRTGSIVASDLPQPPRPPRIASNSSRRAPTGSTQANSYNPTTPQSPTITDPSGAQTKPPGFIGPRGYDVSN